MPPKPSSCARGLNKYEVALRFLAGDKAIVSISLVVLVRASRWFSNTLPPGGGGLGRGGLNGYLDTLSIRGILRIHSLARERGPTASVANKNNTSFPCRSQLTQGAKRPSETRSTWRLTKYEENTTRPVKYPNSRDNQLMNLELNKSIPSSMKAG